MTISSILTRRLTPDDFKAFKQMDTGIEDDYVARIFPNAVEQEVAYGIFLDKQLVCIAGYTLFAGQYAVLGRLRTDRRFRGQGLATHLLKELCKEIDRNHKMVWVGLATEMNNHPVHRIADKLGMTRLSVFESCILTERGQVQMKNQSGEACEWKPVTSNWEKRTLLENVSEEENQLHIFPYECYYPLPYEKALWTDDYLSGCIFLKCRDRFVVLLKDDKGESYLHVKYFWDDAFKQPGLWKKVLEEAEKTGRKVWIDLPADVELPENTADMFRRRTWTCYGRRSPKSVDRP